MVDNLNPNSQFHPYEPMNATPQSDVTSGGLSGMLKKIGINDQMLGNMKNVDVRQSVEKARGYAQKNPSAVLGGLAALAIGLGMMRGRRSR